MTYIKQNIIAKEIYEKIVGKYKNVRVLLIDDLFKVSISKSDVNIMFEIVNFRYFNNLPIIISCEMGIDETLYVDEAVGSRSYEMRKGYLIYTNNLTRHF
ncbi:DNA replication protein [[Clostridium] sordellii]|uniref:IstB-like ATP-binding protein domain-containing protein n=3 Tax=Paraclostridium sordellii TaxID=1505 RepID=A0ABM9RLK0_PARSO|nr:hypothetical protein ATCC9714_07661 [[Clostridium] sordellii] [Paeniclostridium sordellii]CEN68431.1 DNA replication protein [[Clostridium] sordellii] [Paeniclostridium sordellii]CEN71698.1 DNA replication protein [[Clostridium] sordellii] [Paeniclostridium sordellii]CEO22159.1 DNA replication protein [[Clostridium] sordellii] [Paeniclostridium sordellii]CEP76709.1 DNA replication protein [[Clostridium] sordellii] [Paeniclostridium sordellii]